MALTRRESLRQRLGSNCDSGPRALFGPRSTIALTDLIAGTSLSGSLEQLENKSVLVATHDQLATACGLIDLDGLARRLIIVPPDVSLEDLPGIVAAAGIDVVVTDREDVRNAFSSIMNVTCQTKVRPIEVPHLPGLATEWILLTSGTTGVPKMLVHTLATLSSAIPQDPGPSDIVWGTFYDIRRYGGLQIYLRAILGRGSFVLSSVDEPMGDYLLRLANHGATHVTGTPSHWRRALMSPEAKAIEPRYARFSGEIADQPILDALTSYYPSAEVGHAFASTEAGVAFEVRDRLAGFPASFLPSRGNVELKVTDGTLRIRSPGNALGYLGPPNTMLRDSDGFVDTGDIVELRGDRYFFLGRSSGVINVGGLKLQPEEVEAVINLHPAVKQSLVYPRKNSFTGHIVAADVLLVNCSESTDITKREILELCHKNLAKHKVPATIRFVQEVGISASGKIARPHA